MFATREGLGEPKSGGNGPGPCPLDHATTLPGRHAWNQYTDEQREVRRRDPRDLRGYYPVACLCGLVYHKSLDVTVDEE